MDLIEEMAWLAPQWQSLDAYIQSSRVPQALLVVGREGVGKSALATAFGKRLLCRTPKEYACGVCQSCRLFQANTHPDFLRIEPEERGKVIPVEAVRGLIANLALKPQYSGRRVVVISPAHQMNVSSANSLLKTLEEPDEYTTLLLLTDAPHLLPTTILSRCQRLDIPVPDRMFVVAWLAKNGQGERAEILSALARRAPLKALGLANEGIIEKRGEFFSEWRDLAESRGEPTVLAEKWSKFPCETLVDWMISWTMDIIRLSAFPLNREIDNPDLASSLASICKTLNVKQLLGFLDRLNAAHRTLSGQINRQLLLEELLIHWMQVKMK